jgi:hypothetical protein
MLVMSNKALLINPKGITGYVTVNVSFKTLLFGSKTKGRAGQEEINNG